MTGRARRARSTPNLDRLDDSHRSQLVATLLAAHPELLAEAEGIAAGLLTAVDVDVVAEDVVWALTSIDTDDLATRAGRHRGGYVEPTQAAWDLVEEAFEPFLVDLRRLAGLGHIDAATASMRGVLDGLDQLAEPADETVLAWAGPDVATSLADQLRGEARKLGIEMGAALQE